MRPISYLANDFLTRSETHSYGSDRSRLKYQIICFVHTSSQCISTVCKIVNTKKYKALINNKKNVNFGLYRIGEFLQRKLISANTTYSLQLKSNFSLPIKLLTDTHRYESIFEHVLNCGMHVRRNKYETKIFRQPLLSGTIDYPQEAFFSNILSLAFLA